MRKKTLQACASFQRRVVSAPSPAISLSAPWPAIAMDDATPPQFKRGRGRPPMLPNGLKAQKLDGGQWKDELGNIWNHREAVATARKRAVERGC